jgi:hypothetical protein
MTFETFQQLSESEQQLFVSYHGVPVAERIGKLYKHLLVQVECFYVEIVYSVKDSLVRKFRPFDNTDLLDPYLPKINIVFRD